MDHPINYTKKGRPVFDNTPTVVCVLRALGDRRRHSLDNMDHPIGARQLSGSGEVNSGRK